MSCSRIGGVVVCCIPGESDHLPKGLQLAVELCSGFKAHPVDRFCYNMFRREICFCSFSSQGLLCDVDLCLRVLSVVCRMRRDRGDELSVHNSDPSFASL